MATNEGETPKGSSSESDLDKLRGPNITPALFELVESSVRIYRDIWKIWEPYGEDRELMMLHSSRCLQSWATSIDNKVIEASRSYSPQTTSSLDIIIKEMIRKGQISDTLELCPIEKPHEISEGILPFYMDTRPWFVIKALFGIDTSDLDYHIKARIREANNVRFPAHIKMLQLIKDVACQKGHDIENTSIPDQAGHPINAYSIPSDIDGVSFVLAMVDDPYDATWVHKNIHALAGRGFLYIWNIALRFKPSSLAAIRPLTDDEYQKYRDIEQIIHDRVEQERKRSHEARLRGTYSVPPEKPTGQRLYEERYANQMGAAWETIRNFRGSEDQWMDRFPDNGEVPPWIWWEIYQKSRGRRV